MIYFSPSVTGFYDDVINREIPADAKPISAELRTALMIAQSEGAVIAAGSDGNPIAIPRPGPTAEQMLQDLRAERDARLAACDFTQMPDYPISPALKAHWAAYRQQLRDLPETITDPADIIWPTPPTGENI